MKSFRQKSDQEFGAALLEVLVGDTRAPLIAHTLAIAILAISRSIPLFEQLYVAVLSSLILVVSVLRLIATDRVRRRLPRPERFAIYAHHATVLAQATLWGLLMLWSIKQYGFSSETLMLLLICSTVGSGAASTLSAHLSLFNLFVSILVGIPTLVILVEQPGAGNLSLRYFMGLYFVFTLMLGRKQNQIIQKSIRYRLRARRETEKFKAILQSVPGFVSFINTELEYIFASEPMLKAFPEISLEGKATRVGEVDQQDDLKHQVEKFMQSSETTLTCEIQGSARLGGHWYLLSMLKVSAPANGAVLVTIDIDELKRSQLELVRQREKSMNSARLVSLGEMAAGVAHEINNPLTVVVGKSEQIQMLCSAGKTPDPAKISDYAAAIERTAHRIAKIVKGLRAFSRDAAQDPMERVAIKTVIEDTLSLCANRLTKAGVALKIDLTAVEQVLIVGRPIQISQALLSLLTNAYDAVEKSPVRTIEVLTALVGSQVEIRVRDSGGGIPAEIRSKIMHPFFTTKASAHATGLGLSISKGLIESHGGSLALDEADPQTTFVVRLPCELSALNEPAHETDTSAPKVA